MIQTNDFLGECRAFYDQNLKGKFGQPRGTDPEELKAFETRNCVLLPAAYRQYLLWMGSDTSGVLQGSDWFFKDLEDNNLYLPDFLNENHIPIDESRTPVCFFSHQGYMAAWFYLKPETEDDPACYFFTESNNLAAVSREGRFSEFLFKELKRAAC